MTDQQKITAPENDEISLKEMVFKIKDWVAYLKSKIIIIVLFGLIGGILGYTYAYFQKPTYKATLTFALEDDKAGGGGIGSAMGLASSIGIDLGSSGGGGAFAGSNLMELMKSRLLVEKTLLNSVVINGENITMAEYYIRINKLREKWAANVNLNGKLNNIQFTTNADRAKFTLLQDSVLQTLYKALTNPAVLSIQQKDKKVSITTIEVINENENFAKLFCENLIKETSNFYIETKSKKSRLNVEILQKQTDSIRAELNGAITSVAVETDNVFNLNPALNVRSTPGKRKQVEVQANMAILSQLIAQLELAKVNLRKETPLIQIIDHPIFPLEKIRTGKITSLLLGGVLASFLTILFLVFGRIYKKIMAS
jgi:uncharacterized protein involved in exopolysaccharide biosynthesis